MYDRRTRILTRKHDRYTPGKHKQDSKAQKRFRKQVQIENSPDSLKTAREREFSQTNKYDKNEEIKNKN